MRLFGLILALTLFAAAKNITILWPPPHQVVENDTATIVVEPPKEALRLEIFRGKEPIAQKEATSIPLCIPVPLKEGNNTLRIAAYNDGKTLAEANITLFRRTLLQKRFRYPPEPFQKRFFHRAEHERRCGGCHDMSVNETPGVAFEEVNASNCYTCHKSITKRPYLHAPANNWLCATTCHDGKAGNFDAKFAGQSRFLHPDPIAPKCFECHEDFEHRYKVGRYRHEPADDMRCNKCHDPHGSHDKRFLRKEPWELCTTCHVEKKTQPHVVTTFSGRGHPTRGKKIPKKPDEELSCISCHNPHVSNNGFMLRDYMGRGLILWCNRCHEKE